MHNQGVTGNTILQHSPLYGSCTCHQDVTSLSTLDTQNNHHCQISHVMVACLTSSSQVKWCPQCFCKVGSEPMLPNQICAASSRCAVLCAVRHCYWGESHHHYGDHDVFSCPQVGHISNCCSCASSAHASNRTTMNTTVLCCIHHSIWNFREFNISNKRT